MSKYVTISELNEALARQAVMLLDRIGEKLDEQTAAYDKKLSEQTKLFDKKLSEQTKLFDTKLSQQTEDICDQMNDMMKHSDDRINRETELQSLNLRQGKLHILTILQIQVLNCSSVYLNHKNSI